MAFLGGFFNQFLNQLGTGDQVKDYQHAARTFVDGLYRLGPKFQNLFHVYVDLNPTAATTDQNSQIEIGLLAKSVNLPKFSVQTKTYNAYNRKNIAQEKIKYDPVSMTFHDDSSNIVRNFWYDYYSYYYRDSDHQEPLYNMDHKYQRRQTQEWGYTPKASVHYINSIRIYSLHQKQFSSYILIRPIITTFEHGEHLQGEYVPLQHSMTIDYEAVQYEYGPVSSGTVQGFNVIHYDNSPSPLTSLGGGTTSILGPGGLVEGIGSTVTNLQNGNFLGAGLGALRTFNNFKNADLKTIAGAELQQTAMNILRGQNSQSSIFVPTQSAVADALSKAVNAKPGAGATSSGVSMTGMNAQNNAIGSTNAGKIGN